MIRTTLPCFLLAAALPLAACGDDDTNFGGSGTGDPAEAGERSVTAAQNVEALAQNPNDGDALASVSELYAHMQTIQASAAVESAPTQSVPGMLIAEQAQFADACVTTVGTTSTYDGCELEGATLDGTVTSNGTSADIDITMMIDPAAYNGQMPADSPGASITIDGVSVHEYGTLDFVNGITGTMNFDIDVTVTVDMGGMPGMEGVPGLDGPVTQTQSQSITGVFDVRLTDGCATGGTLTVSGSGVGGTGNSTTVVTFGPNCGDASAEVQ